MKILFEKLKDIFTLCPDCKGERGQKEVILDDGSGPWYDCGFCNGTGYVNVFRKLRWKPFFVYWENQAKKRRKKELEELLERQRGKKCQN